MPLYGYAGPAPDGHQQGSLLLTQPPEHFVFHGPGAVFWNFFYMLTA